MDEFPPRLFNKRAGCMHETTICGGVFITDHQTTFPTTAVPCKCGHADNDHDETDGCLAKVEGYDGLGTCPCPRYKEAGS